MAHRTWKLGVLLGFVGMAVASGCVVKTSDGDDETGGEAGEGGSSGSSTGGKGGSSGSATGGKGGSSTGGSSTGGSSGSSTGGSGNAPNTEPECDPSSGELDNTPFPNCEPTDPSNECEVCIEESCCEFSQVCYGYDPGNVCGWGGIDLDDDEVLDGEITCYVACAQAYVEEYGVYDEDAVDECTGMCATEECGIIGNATQDLVVCIEESCPTECFGI